MPHVEIYLTPTCPYCKKAQRLLTEKGIEFERIDVAADPKRRGEMMDRADDRETVPQIFIDGEHIGGCDDLYALNREGGLDSKLGL